MAELYEHTATELAAAIRAGDASCREVVEAHLARIDAVDGHVNAVTVALRDDALAAADELDRAEPSGPLFGVPFTIKENIDCLGSATTHGVRALANALPYADAPVVARMRAAGAIPLARTNQSELGMRLDTDNPLRGRTLNPWRAAVTAGGSSGGDAAALATGMTPLGLGNDIGGSLRNPAYCCGVAALKPTAGRIPHARSLPPIDDGMAGQAMLVQGPMARSVADLRLALGVLAGRDIRDPRSVDAPLSGPPPAERRAALVTDVPGGEVCPAVTAAIARAGAALADAGWTVEHAAPPELERTCELWGQLMATDLADTTVTMRGVLSGSLLDHIARLCDLYDVDAVPNPALHAERARLTRAWSHFFARYPVAVAPTWTCPPWPIDADLDPNRGVELLRHTTWLITPGNVLGLPSVAVPTGVADGLPTGVQIYADLWREDLCLDAAAVVEAAVGTITPIDPIVR